jgi:hypothetical protein
LKGECWSGWGVIGMNQTRVDKKMIESKPEGKIKVGRLRLRWLEDVDNDL